ncbi:hypothetical protein KC340_g15880 [Hortaea werneckii]|nr:hypothetical protein KC342_g1169 [Hortaea werneckii]KAI7108659.1 hypothetical protein KC339_g1365 [Hortaea werneckii]KAI7245405.1 hypothetical protein KC365_g491 [Hortaea werneckii]KAI7295176.1 hypothetical protein KC340_g15880 [Hortaea werneckii]KAI7397690.1 hypothetical protein KC328_g4789 [Hortaea werneckii]
MARLLDLTEEEDGEAEAEADLGGKRSEAVEDHRPNPNIGKCSASLGCYPIISQLASYVDLNTLHELSRTCRQIRANILQYRRLLIEQALHCTNDDVGEVAQLGDSRQSGHDSFTTYGRDGRIGRMSSGKVGSCARDMVGECRKCGTPVCRNCILKPPPSNALKLRHRRLCRACVKSPLPRLTVQLAAVPECDGFGDVQLRLYSRSPCSCDNQLWICQPCGQTSRNADTTYIRGWAWRARYSVCGGLGAGLGEANEGVECGRGSECLAAREVFHEHDCDEDELENEMANAEIDSRHMHGSSYTTQEIVGIGGRVKRKVKKRVHVGAIVKEYEDERLNGKFLSREQNGANRSWCSWCCRVVPGKKDAGNSTSSTDSIVSSASSIST